MQDLNQEEDDVMLAGYNVEPPRHGNVTLRHPHTGDTKTVDGIPEELVPLMLQGYQQVK